jgi:adenylate cyclase class IV
VLASARQAGETLALKARDRDPRASLLSCESLGADAREVSIQRDTYFQGPRGRLKLREQGERAFLFAYERLTLLGHPERRWLFEVRQPEVVMAAYSKSLGVEAIVVKRRRTFLWRGIHIHLDAVEDLGSFIKLHPAGPDESGLADEGRVRALRRTLRIEDADLLTESYCDLLLAAAGRPGIV